MTKKIILIAGATATGKSKAAIQLAKLLSAEIISADSRLVYKDLNIGTAKPNPQELKEVKHHLIDIIEPVKTFSAGDFEHAAKEILTKDGNFIIVGGTGFYINTLISQEKLPEIPQNKELREELSIKDNAKIYSILEKLDPVRSKQIHPNNRDKIIRSIEMCHALNAPISSYKPEKNTDYDIKTFILEANRDTLYKKIDERVDSMLQEGLYEEFLSLKEKYPASPILNSTIGYKEFFEYEYKQAVEKIKQHTRNYAKRQLTWIRHKINGVTVNTTENTMEYIVKGIYKSL